MGNATWATQHGQRNLDNNFQSLSPVTHHPMMGATQYGQLGNADHFQPGKLLRAAAQSLESAAKEYEGFGETVVQPAALLTNLGPQDEGQHWTAGHMRVDARPKTSGVEGTWATYARGTVMPRVSSGATMTSVTAVTYTNQGM